MSYWSGQVSKEPKPGWLCLPVWCLTLRAMKCAWSLPCGGVLSCGASHVRIRARACAALWRALGDGDYHGGLRFRPRQRRRTPPLSCPDTNSLQSPLRTRARDWTRRMGQVMVNSKPLERPTCGSGVSRLAMACCGVCVLIGGRLCIHT